VDEIRECSFDTHDAQLIPVPTLFRLPTTILGVCAHITINQPLLSPKYSSEINRHHHLPQNPHLDHTTRKKSTRQQKHHKMAEEVEDAWRSPTVPVQRAAILNPSNRLSCPKEKAQQVRLRLRLELSLHPQIDHCPLRRRCILQLGDASR
jgi:hypothetical protein